MTEWTLTSAFMLLIFLIGDRIEKRIKKNQPSTEKKSLHPIQKVCEGMLLALIGGGAFYFGFTNEDIISSELYFLSAAVIFFSLSAWMEWKLDQKKKIPLLTLLQLGTSLSILIVVCVIEIAV
ncbi:DUF4181 domain-containing protein [Bacillus sp. Marseille-Q1617]|uniref:DUF4181 domain-containing protein n=1 Tax=Bacillus sp. Marseille-Q1617 TaxID=2736887 RepID=UPI00158A992D|nr:hypothetical protein [Bacillus sp. Marseille-Q1617]